MAKQCHVIPIDVPVLPFHKLLFQVHFQPLPIFFRPPGHAEKLPSACAASAAAFRDNIFFDCQKPFVGWFVRPSTTVSGMGELLVQNGRGMDNLVSVHNDGVSQVLPGYIKRGNVVAGVIPGIFNQMNSVILLGPLVKLLFAVADDDINLIDVIDMERCNQRVDHADSVHLYQGLWRCQRDGAKPLTNTGSHDNCPLYHLLSHNLCRIPSCILREKLPNTPSRSHTAAGRTHRTPHRNGV